jgi:poly(hydroxyalkanoate) granule-associated protein
VWLAGLGALNIAQQESGKILERGSKLFEKLVEEGGKFESKTRSDLEGAVSDLRGEVENRMSGVKQRTDSVRKQAADNWDKLEKIFEERVARALARLGIPTRDDIKGLSERVQSLAEQVRALDSGKSGPSASSSRKKATSRKTAPGKAAVKKTSKKKAKKKAVKKTVVKKSGSGKS